MKYPILNKLAWFCLPVTLSALATLHAADALTELKVRITWGQQSPVETPFYIRLVPYGMEMAQPVSLGFETGDSVNGNTCETKAGRGDVDGVELNLRYPEILPKTTGKLHPIWAGLVAQSDPDTVRRLDLAGGFRIDPRKLTVQMNREGTQGFSVTVDQLLANHVIWVPSLDVYVTAGDPPVSFADHLRQLQAWQGKRILDQVHREAEASYEQYTSRWEDMGSPSYQHPTQPAPGHIVGLTWDSALYKFGIDRGAGVWNDYGNSDHFRFSFDFGDLSAGIAQTWKGQKLADGLPIITTVFEKDGVRYEVEQFAYPLNGPPGERKGDIPMVLFQKVKMSELAGVRATNTIKLFHRRELPATAELKVVSLDQNNAFLLAESATQSGLLVLEGGGLLLQSTVFTNVVEGKSNAKMPPGKSLELVMAFDLAAHGSHECIIKLPSPVVSPAGLETLRKLDYAEARAATVKFWSDYLARGAQFRVPEKAVNDLCRAGLWHALRLPRRHGGSGPNATIDLPYSNFAYDQKGTPWPVNQAVYVDYMIYDLRGYHAIAEEELAAIYRNNQTPNGHVGGFANWGVYTPGMIYSVAQDYLLSHDRKALDQLVPPTLKALDWCLAEIKRANERSGPSQGLVQAPLNDGTGDGLWAFNQAYIYASLDLFGKALAQIGHPRAEECLSAARAFQAAVERGFGAATMNSPLVQLRDHTWIPYVPCEAVTPRRLIEQWYPTDVDTGALHLPRLRALPPQGVLTDYLLQDHEDNLYAKGWGMANEPVYNQQATAYLLRDDPKAVIRAFYSYMACAFSHSVFEPVEHRWTWGQYYGPPSTDGAWFELYRNMLVREAEDDALFLLQATPRKWLENGKQIAIENAPTYYGPVTLKVTSETAAQTITAKIDLVDHHRPKTLLLRLRHPNERLLKSVTVNGQPWANFDPIKEWVCIKQPIEKSYLIKAYY